MRTTSLVAILLALYGSVMANVCVTRDASGACLSCDTLSLYILKAGACVKVNIQNCKSINLDGMCTECEEGFTTTSDKLACLAKIPRCEEVSPSTKDSQVLTCALCIQSFRPTDDKRACLQNILFCTTFDPSTFASPYLTCSVCQTGFFPSDDRRRCQKQIDNCFSYLPNNFFSFGVKCALCGQGFAVSPDQLACIKVVENCSVSAKISNSPAVKTLCATCNHGYILSADKLTCLSASIIKCLSYQDVTGASSQITCRTCRIFLASVLMPKSVCQWWQTALLTIRLRLRVQLWRSSVRLARAATS